MGDQPYRGFLLVGGHDVRKYGRFKAWCHMATRAKGMVSHSPHDAANSFREELMLGPGMCPWYAWSIVVHVWPLRRCLMHQCLSVLYACFENSGLPYAWILMDWNGLLAQIG
jgi:hypothetical protein